MTGDHETPEDEQLPKAWISGGRETESRQKRGAKELFAGHCRIR